MPQTTIERAYAALFDLASNAAKFVTFTRDIRQWSRIEGSPASQPAIIQEQGKIRFEAKPNIPTIIRLNADLAILCNTSDAVKVPAPTLNALVDAVLTALAPSPSDDYRQTLGGIVYDCKPMGDGFLREATSASPQSYALIPIEIILTM